MPEPVALSWRGRLVDDYAVNLPIVEDDGLKLPNCLTPSHPALQRIEGNRFMSSADIETEDTRTYTILLISKDDFIFTDGETVFYEERFSD